MELVTRRVGRRLTVAGSTTTRVFFGPFTDAELLWYLSIFLDTSATPAAGEFLTVEVGAFQSLPADTAAAFAANGRPMVTGLPGLPVVAGAWDIPIQFRGNATERYIGVQFTEANTDTFEGSIWAWVSDVAVKPSSAG